MLRSALKLIVLVLLLTGCSPRLIRVEQTEPLLGTTVTITVLHEDYQKAKEAVEEAFAEIKRIETLMSTYINTSEVSILNNKGLIKNASADLIFVIKKSLYYSDISNGAFDITVQPILELYRNSFFKKGMPPTGDEINKTLKLVNYRRIFVKGKTIFFSKKGMKITLGGIAKGYAIDSAIRILKQHGISHALVNAGGDMRAIGMKDAKKPWTIALQNPRDKKDVLAVIPLNNKAVATSGDYERYFEPTKKFHHIVNPKTGYSATELISVTIVSSSAIDADALATAVFVLGPEEGMKLINTLNDTEGLLITKDREIITSEGLNFNLLSKRNFQ